MGALIYTPTGWVDDDGTDTVGTEFTAARMNKLESGIDAVTTRTNEIDLPARGLMNDGGFDGMELASGSSRSWTYTAATSAGITLSPITRTGKGQAARITATVTGGTYLLTTRIGSEGGDFPVIGGERYVVMGWVRCNNARQIRPRALIYDDAVRTTNVLIPAVNGGEYGSYNTAEAGEWKLIKHDFICPGTVGQVYYCRVLLYPGGDSTAGDVWDFDDFESYHRAAPLVTDVYDINAAVTQLDMPVDSSGDQGWKFELDLAVHYDTSLYLRPNGALTAVNEVRRVINGRQDLTVSTSDVASNPTGLRFFNNIGSLTANETYVNGEVNVGRYQGGGRVARGHSSGAGQQAVSGALDWVVVNDFTWRMMGSGYNAITFFRLFSDQASGILRGRVRVTRL